jgi:hypothetical protein
VTHFIAILFFSGLLVGLATMLHLMVSAHWDDMIAALRGQPMPSRRVVTRAAPRVRGTRHAAA